MSKDEILSQEQIDAILGEALGFTDSAPAPAPAPVKTSPAQPPTAEPVPGPAPQQSAPVRQAAPAPPDDATQVMLTTLAKRVERVEATLERMAQLDTVVSATSDSVTKLEHEFRAILRQLQAIGGQVEGIVGDLNSTLGYRAQETFACKSCQVQRQVAARIKCTDCGEESWWGWWPQRQ